VPLADGTPRLAAGAGAIATADAEHRTCATTDVSVKNVPVSWPTLVVRVTSHEARKGRQENASLRSSPSLW
jgi:hypothetical protein